MNTPSYDKGDAGKSGKRPQGMSHPALVFGARKPRATKKRCIRTARRPTDAVGTTHAARVRRGAPAEGRFRRGAPRMTGVQAEHSHDQPNRPSMESKARTAPRIARGLAEATLSLKTRKCTGERGQNTGYLAELARIGYAHRATRGGSTRRTARIAHAPGLRAAGTIPGTTTP